MSFSWLLVGMVIDTNEDNMFLLFDPLNSEIGDIPLEQIQRRAQYICTRIEIETQLQDYLDYGNYSALSVLLSKAGIKVTYDKNRGHISETDKLRDEASAWGGSTFGKVNYALHLAELSTLPPEALDEGAMPEYLMEMFRLKIMKDTTPLQTSGNYRTRLFNQPREYDITSFLGSEQLFLNQERASILSLWTRYKQNGKNIPPTLIQPLQHYERWLNRSADYYYFPNAPKVTDQLAKGIRNKPVSIMPVVFRNANLEILGINHASSHPEIIDNVLSRFLSLANFERVSELMSIEPHVHFDSGNLRTTITNIKDTYVNAFRAFTFDDGDNLINNQVQFILDLEEIFSIGRREIEGEAAFFTDAELALLRVTIYHLHALNSSVRGVINKLTAQSAQYDPAKERDLSKNIIELFTRTLEYTIEEMSKKF